MRREVHSIYGRTGSGKSTLAHELAGAARKLIIFDPMDEYKKKLKHVRQTSDLNRVRQWISDPRATSYRVAYVPEEDYPLELSTLAKIIWDVQEGNEENPVWLLIEEANMGYPATRLPKGQNGVQNLILRGRHRGINLIFVTQRPAGIHPDLRTNAEHQYFFGLAHYEDRRIAKHTLGNIDVLNLSIGEYFEWNLGQVEKKETKPKNPI